MEINNPIFKEAISPGLTFFSMFCVKSICGLYRLTISLKMKVTNICRNYLWYNTLHFPGVSWLKGNAECLPVADNSYDAYTIAFGIRNTTHINKVNLIIH